MKKTIEGFIPLNRIEQLRESGYGPFNLMDQAVVIDDIKVTITYELPAKKYSVTAEEIANLKAIYDSCSRPRFSFLEYVVSHFNQEGK